VRPVGVSGGSGGDLDRHALVLGSFFAVIGGVLITGGGIVLAIAMESVLAKESLDTDSRAGAA
jgi:hypothetical protein